MSLILGIESSCDETSCAVVKDGCDVLSCAVASQIAKHALHGGVVPELAAREHLVALKPVLKEALDTAGVAAEELSAIAVTQGPGLMPALLVGLNFAKGLSLSLGKPLIGINHFLGHIYGAFLGSDLSPLTDKNSYPMLALVVSGGHTSLMLVQSDGSARQLGCTIDDAAGEALDKGAKLLDLGYPGGPIMQKTAALGDPRKYGFPRPLTGTAGKALSPENKYNFSFSGIKTALLYHVKRHMENGGTLSGVFLHDTAASYQEAVVDVLATKTIRACKEYQCRTLIAAGGVACNAVLRERLQQLTPAGVTLKLAPRKFCTDNAAMIGGLAYFYFLRKEFSEQGIDSYARLLRITRMPFVL